VREQKREKNQFHNHLTLTDPFSLLCPLVSLPDDRDELGKEKPYMTSSHYYVDLK
jgi:hypothetical protein